MYEEKYPQHDISRIYQTYYKDVYNFLFHFTGDKNNAEDLTQETFLRILKSLSNYSGKSSLKTWVFSVAKHVALDHYRRKKFTSVLSGINFLKNIPSTEGIPEMKVEHGEVRHLVHQALLALKPNYRAVIILRALRELSIKETAEILGCSESKVKVDYHRALKKLQQEIGLEGGLECLPSLKKS
ncbi:MAG: RNA polymerase sigma factor [Bacillaceae bacterium]|nr:RNA polymerase sigma factor [Bacillaceae bacterium]